MLVGLLCSIYLILFVVGVGSNGWALVRAIGVLRMSSAGRKRAGNGQEEQPSRETHLVLLPLIISLVNLALHICLLFFMSDVLAQSWSLGVSVCWYYWWSESLAKTFVGLLLAAFALERLLYTVEPALWRRVCRVSTLMLVLVVDLAASVLVAAPIQPYVDVRGPPGTNRSDVGKKCGISEQIPASTLRYHIVGTFAFAYVAPLSVAVVGYGYIIGAHLRSFYRRRMSNARDVQVGRQSSDLVAEPIDLRVAVQKRITWFCVLLNLLFVACWSPYWLTTITVQFSPSSADSNELQQPITIVVCHILPYVNGAASGVLYALMSRKLRMFQRVRTLASSYEKEFDLHSTDSYSSREN